MRPSKVLAVVAVVVSIPAAAQPCVHECCDFAFSCSGGLPGRNCVKVNEPSDPDTWHDNFFCGPGNLELKWSYAGPIPNMRCTAITEGSEPPEHTWTDNYLCVPKNASWELAWSSAGAIQGQGYTCVNWNEPSDHETWNDNFLCARPSPYVTPAGRAEFPIVQGQATTEKPAVGRFSVGCGATMVAPRIAVTASHCVAALPPGTKGSITFTRASGTQFTHAVSDVFSMGNGSGGEDDVAFLALERSGCTNLPKPLGVAAAFPPLGADVTVLGFGCNVRSSACKIDTRRFVAGKQVVKTKFGHSALMCPGDSGGPLLVGDKVAGVVSAYDCGTQGFDIFGDVVRFRDRLTGLAQTHKCEAEGNPDSQSGGCPDGLQRCVLRNSSPCLSGYACQKRRQQEERPPP
ncbi:MAG: trypsin-like serine protease [Myxococcaceae bacterium]|nr:trypsin-like serine protease [Myxococcaceae bacterium]